MNIATLTISSQNISLEQIKSSVLIPAVREIKIGDVRTSGSAPARYNVAVFAIREQNLSIEVDSDIDEDIIHTFNFIKNHILNINYAIISVNSENITSGSGLFNSRLFLARMISSHVDLEVLS